MSTCSIKWCGKNSKTSNYKADGITFHRFPKDPDIKKVWIDATRRENWLPSSFSVLCSRHFTNDCYERVTNRRRLFASAVPTLLLPQLSSIDIKTQSDDEEPSNLKTIQNSIDDSFEEPTKTQITDDFSIKPTDSRSTKVLCRKLSELSKKLNKKRLCIKRLRDSNRFLKQKVSTMKNLMVKLKNKELISQENIDIDRLQNSNRQLRKKVNWLKNLLNEQKNKNLVAAQNVVWCPSVDETMVVTKNNLSANASNV